MGDQTADGALISLDPVTDGDGLVWEDRARLDIEIGHPRWSEGRRRMDIEAGCS